MIECLYYCNNKSWARRASQSCCDPCFKDEIDLNEIPHSARYLGEESERSVVDRDSRKILKECMITK